MSSDLARLAPGASETDFAGGMIRKPEYDEVAASMTAMGRIDVPDDIGAVIASLLSDDHHWMNRPRIAVSVRLTATANACAPSATTRKAGNSPAFST